MLPGSEYGYPSLLEVMRSVNADLIAAEEKALRDAMAASSLSTSSSSHQSPLADSSHLPPPPPPHADPSVAPSVPSAAGAVAAKVEAAPHAVPSAAAVTELDDSVKSFSLNDHLDIRDPHGKWLQAKVRGNVSNMFFSTPKTKMLRSFRDRVYACILTFQIVWLH